MGVFAGAVSVEVIVLMGVGPVLAALVLVWALVVVLVVGLVVVRLMISRVVEVGGVGVMVVVVVGACYRPAGHRRNTYRFVDRWRYAYPTGRSQPDRLRFIVLRGRVGRVVNVVSQTDMHDDTLVGLYKAVRTHQAVTRCSAVETGWHAGNSEYNCLYE